PIPITTAPSIWLRAGFGLIMRPASMTLTNRDTRSRAVSGCQVTSANCAPNECSEYFRLSSPPKVVRDCALPTAARTFARASTSPNGTPDDGSLFRATRPLAKWRSSGVAPAKAAFFPDVDSVSSDRTAARAAAETAGITDAVAQDPPEIGPGGSVVS